MVAKVISRLYAYKYVFLALALCFTLYNLTSYSKTSFTYTGIIHLDAKRLREFFTHFHHRNDKLASIKSRSVVYDEIFSQINLFDFLEKHSFEDRCLVYFNHLLMSNPDWMVNPDERVSFNREAYNKYQVYRDRVMNEQKQKAEEAQKNGDPVPAQLTEEQVRKEYDSLRKTVLDDEQTLHDYMAHVRIFEKCFLGLRSPAALKDDKNFVRNQRNFLQNGVSYISSPEERLNGKIFNNELACEDVEAKVFPWLTTNYPLFLRWNGETPFFPGSQDSAPGKEPGCFLKNYKRRLNGKGIVMTLGNDHVKDASRFFRILRHLGNRYPIQIVYHSNLDEKSRLDLIRAARTDFRGYAPLDIWFVDASRAIEPQYIPKFEGFANKIMATMFNSFEEVLFCDADSVLLESPEYFFKLKKYIDKGTMFYKDRAAGQYRGNDDIVLFKKLLPSVEDSVVFNIPQTTNFTLNNEFFGGFSHYMESGVVVLNRRKHFMQPIVMAILNFYKPIVSRIYGDKELFWLALALGGDEQYAFNDNFAAAIGELTPETERHKDVSKVKSFRSKEICSNHPAHISDIDNQTLAWFNSGFRHCGNSLKPKMNWEFEFDLKKRYSWIKTLEEFKTFFQDQLVIKHAILPPFEPEHRLLRNVEHEPENSWTMTKYCLGYCWCAYSLIGGYYEENGETKDNVIEGRVLTFTPLQVKHFQDVGDVWIAEFDW